MMSDKALSRFASLLGAAILATAAFWPSWSKAQISPPPLPPQAGHAGEYLGTNGAKTAWSSPAAAVASVKNTSKAFVFSDASPIAALTTAAGDVIDRIDVVVDAPFDGIPTLAIGIIGTPAKYMQSATIDLTQGATTIFQRQPGLPAQGVESIIGTYTQGGATQGAARILIYYGTPL
jgi:hypothetical protein